MAYQEFEIDEIKSPFDVDFNDPNNIIGFEEYNPSERFERINERYNSNFGQVSPLLSIVREEIGADYILTGDPDNPTQISLYDLNDRQLADLLRYRYMESSSNNDDSEYDLDDHEIELLNALRLGDKTSALSLLGVNPFENFDYSDDDIIEWKLRTLYPDMSDEEINEEIDLWKQSPNADKKLQNAREEFLNSINEYQRLKDLEIEREKEEILEKEAEQISSLIEDIDSLYQFEVDDDTKNKIHDLIFNRDESGKSKIVSLMDDPVGLLEVAASMAILPKVAGYVNQLLYEIDELKKNRNIVVDDKNIYNSRQNSFGRYEDGVEDVTKYFVLG